MEFRQVSPQDLLGPLNEVEQKNAPGTLFTAGDVSLCQNFPRVSVIGTRRISPLGISSTENLVRLLVKRGVVVVSGLALGVDACAHRTAVEAGGRTIAVLGTPLDQFYPKENADLQRRIMAEHLAISQFRSGAAVHKANFPMRNRTMALISHATVIVEASETSGTIHQGWEALRLGRALFILESLMKRTDLAWPRKMVSYGAQALTNKTAEVLFESLPQGNLRVDLSAVPF